MSDFIVPEWPVPQQVRAAVTTREGGVSQAPFDSFNLAQHVGDDAEAVSANRRRLVQALQLTAEPVWLDQVHGKGVADLDAPHAAIPRWWHAPSRRRAPF